ncbi:MAG: hypothetical protein JWP81_2014 [Ferruginibacter sp.]|nr:hypothetical protein [Ferruginibacter sp.]
MKKIIIIGLFVVAIKATQAQQQNVLSYSLQKDTIPASRDTTMKDYVSMQAGQMILVQHEKVSRLTKDITMKNGTVVKTDGTVKTYDGRNLQLKEGDRVYMNGMVEGPARELIN